MRTGRPPKLDEVISHRDIRNDNDEVVQRVPVTRIDQIVQDLSIGLAAHRAARRAGITPETFYEWERVAGRARGPRPDGAPRLTTFERRCLEFSDRVMAAELEWETRQNALLEQVARGNQPIRVETVKVDDTGKEIERTVKTSRTLPNPNVILTRLKLRLPDEYQERVTVGGLGEAGAIPIEVRAQGLADALARFRGAPDDTDDDGGDDG